MDLSLRLLVIAVLGTCSPAERPTTGVHPPSGDPSGPDRIRVAAADAVAGTAGSPEPASRPGSAARAAQDTPTAGSIGGELVLDPEGVTLPGGRRIATAHPIARALEWAAPGAQLTLQAGEYGSVGIGHASTRAWNSRAAGGTALKPVRVVGRGRARIVAGDQPDALTIHQQVPCAHVHFEDLEIHAGYRAGVLFSDLGAEDAHTGFHFYDCTIDGDYDHVAAEGTPSKWGVLGHALDDFVFAGRSGRAKVHHTCHEHAFYLQNPRGDITIEKVDGFELGRTFVQIVARERSGPIGRGIVRIVDNHVRDAGIAKRDGYKGGSAFTFAGRLTGCTILLEGNRYRAGFRPELLRLRNKNNPYGTGALVAWDEGAGALNGTLVLRDNDFEMAPGTGDRPLVSIGATRRVVIEANNRFVSGGTWAALYLDPVERDGSLKGPANELVHLERGVAIDGDLLIRGERPTEAELEALAVPPHER